MYGKEIATKPDWLEDANALVVREGEAMVDLTSRFLRGKSATASNACSGTERSPYTTVFAEDEAFKDFSLLLQRDDIGLALNKELRGLAKKYANWGKA
jgi:hypothetical protein